MIYWNFKSSVASALTTCLCVFLFTLSPQSLWAQPADSAALGNIDYSEVNDFEIGGLEVKGNKFTNANAIINLCGLTVGKTVKIPGDDMKDAIKKLWKLKLFTDVQIIQTKRIGAIIFLEIHVKERPRLARYYYVGIPKGQHEDMNKVLEKHLTKGSIVTDNMKVNAQTALKGFFAEKGYLDANISIKEDPDSILTNSSKLGFVIKKGKKIKISEIVFNGNEQFSDKKLRKKLKDTKKMRFVLGIFKPSKYIKAKYESDKENLLKFYKSNGMSDARILRDSVYTVTDSSTGRRSLKIEMDMYEGIQYRFGDIAFKGNTIYNEDILRRTIQVKKGDIYNEELLQSRLNYDQQGRDISTLYMDNGYLFFRITPVETGINKDSINLEIRIFEGPQATIANVRIEGNDRTHEHVIRREIRTRPGQKFSRSDIIRSQREIVALNYFNPEALGINTPVNPAKGTVDIEYKVEEKPSDQLELSAGWGGGGQQGAGVIGTLGVSFNNFSLRNLGKPETWSPLPQGDGQRLSLRVQTNGKFFQSYNFSFTEPWLGGRRPNSLSFSASYMKRSNGYVEESSAYQQIGIFSSSLIFGTRLKWPDDYFISQTSLNFQNYNMRAGNSGYSAFSINFTDENGTRQILDEGNFNALSIGQTIARNSVDDPLFPKSGSKFTLDMKFSLPFSLFNSGTDYSKLGTNDRFRWLEYHKWSFKSEWYHTLVGKLVAKTYAKVGFLGFYNSQIGTSPFERFQLGGDGISNFQGFQGFDIISQRGYTAAEVNPQGSQGGAPLYNKFGFELRYPISLNPQSTIFALLFAEGGNSWNRFADYNPADLKRSVGGGVRIFLPMFGMLGFDYGIGFDKNLGTGRSAWDYGRFNIVLGFEPE